MNIGLFGGTFDPIHHGHIALAHACLERCKLNRIYFVPANIPPHKQGQPLSPFIHRFAMLALATAQVKAFVPSLLEAGEEPAPATGKRLTAKPNYTIDTVRRLKESFKKSDRLFLLIGIDAFAEIAQWHESEALFRECAFIVASRPGIRWPTLPMHYLRVCGPGPRSPGHFRSRGQAVTWCWRERPSTFSTQSTSRSRQRRFAKRRMRENR